MVNKQFEFHTFAEKSLFSCTVEPTAANAKAVVVMCYPFGIEHLYGQRAYFNTAEYLASQGVTCILFDYKGSGDSSHTFEETSPASHLADITDMIRLAKNRYADYSIGLFGMRLGGTWAALAALDNQVDFLILWSPILDVENYLNRELRKSLSTQAKILKKVVYDRDQIRQHLKDGENLVVDGFQVANIDGYGLNRDYIVETEGLNLLTHAGRLDRPMLIVDVMDREGPVSDEYAALLADNSKQQPQSALQAGREEAIPWQQSKFYYSRPAQLMSLTWEWLQSLLDARSVA